MKKVRRISFSEIFDYATCPLKYKFKKEGLLPRATQDVYADITIDALQKFFSQVGMGKRIDTATKKATQYWVERWTAHEFGKDQQREAYKYFSKGKLLVTRISELYHPKQDKVATSSYPLEIAVTPSIIVTDSLDLLLVRTIKQHKMRDRVYYRLIQFCKEADVYNSRYLDYRSSMVRLALQRDLNTRLDTSLDYSTSGAPGKGGFTMVSTDRSYIYEIRSIYGEDKVVHPRLHYLKTVYRITSNICNSIANGYFYATTSKEACRNCEFKNICQLSLVNS